MTEKQIEKMVKQIEAKVTPYLPFFPAKHTETINIKYQPFAVDQDPPILNDKIWKKLKKHNIGAQILVTFPINDGKCIFCDSTNHPSYLCNLSLQERKTRLRLNKICPKCLEKDSHKLYKCDTTDICKICSSKNHHIFMCPQNKLTNGGFNILTKIPIKSSEHKTKN